MMKMVMMAMATLNFKVYKLDGKRQKKVGWGATLRQQGFVCRV